MRRLVALPALAALVAFAPAALAQQDDEEVEVTARPRRRPARPAQPAPPAVAVQPAPPAVEPVAPTPPPPPPSPTQAEVDALRERLAALEGRLATLEHPPPPPPAPPPPPPPPPEVPAVRVAPPRYETGLLDPVGLVLSGYAQLQYESSQLSEDQLQQGGLPYNRDRFVVRRGRIRVDGSWRWATATLELDGSTTRGPFVGVRRAEASFVWRNPSREAPPYVQVTAGLTEIPFGHELPAGVRRRVFMERSLASLAFFRAEPDVGVRVSGGVSFFRYALSVMNGTPLDDRPNAAPLAPTAGKTLLGRLGFDTGPSERLQLSGGASFLAGTGLHAGTDATAPSVVWRDLNENSAIDGGELNAVPGRAATPSVTYGFWAAALDVSARLHTRLGTSHLYGELTVANNLDRGVFPSDPVAAGADVRQLGCYVAFTQEVFRWGLVGFRWDYYDANSDFLVTRQGRFVPASLAVQTFSPVVGVNLGDHLRLLFQYDAIVDTLGRDARGVPVDLANDQWTLRTQVDL